MHILSSVIPGQPGQVKECEAIFLWPVTAISVVKPTGNSSVAAVQSCFCFIIVAAVIVLGIGALFLLFVLLYSQRVSSQSCETLGELLHHPRGRE